MILPSTDLGKNRLWGDLKSFVLYKRSLRYCWNIQVEISSRMQDVYMFVIIVIFSLRDTRPLSA